MSSSHLPAGVYDVDYTWAAASIGGWCLFLSGLRTAQRVFKGGYLRNYSIRVLDIKVGGLFLSPRVSVMRWGWGLYVHFVDDDDD